MAISSLPSIIMHTAPDLTSVPNALQLNKLSPLFRLSFTKLSLSCNQPVLCISFSVTLTRASSPEKRSPAVLVFSVYLHLLRQQFAQHCHPGCPDLYCLSRWAHLRRVVNGMSAVGITTRQLASLAFDNVDKLNVLANYIEETISISKFEGNTIRYTCKV